MLRKCLYVAAIYLAFAPAAHANFTICNESRSRAMSVAVAWQFHTLFPTPIRVDGWTRIPPNRCEVVSPGRLHQHSYYVLAVSGGNVMTVLNPSGREGLFHRSSEAFCVSDTAFGYARHGPVSSCPSGQRLQTFPIGLTQTLNLGKMRLTINPDHHIPKDPPPKLPDLHGAAAFAAGNFSFSALLDTEEAARQAALKSCKATAPSGRQCEINFTFKNQCAVVMLSIVRNVYTSVLSQVGQAADEAEFDALARCFRTDGLACETVNVTCSTRAALPKAR